VEKLPDAIITASLTLGGGVVLMVATQIFTRFVAKPLVEFRRVIGEVAYTLILHSNVLFNPFALIWPGSPGLPEATAECRKLASRLIALSAAVPLYGFFVDLGAVPELTKVYQAAKALIGLSNTRKDTGTKIVQEHYNTISRCLRIRVD
jgi:hypothetical protein